MRTVSIGSMIKSLSGVIGTKDLSAWEDEFVTKMVDITADGKATSHLSDKQVERIDEIYRKHFA